MKCVCPKCLSVTDSNNTLIKGSLPAYASIIGFGFFSTAISLHDNDYLFLILGLLAIIIGTIFTVYYFKKFSKICPKCKHDKMLSINEPEGQRVLAEHGISIRDDSTHHCSNCGYGSDGIVQNKIWSIALIIVGILSLPFASTYHIIALPGSLVYIGMGIYGLRTNYKKSFTCPNCKNKTLVAIDSK